MSIQSEIEAIQAQREQLKAAIDIRQRLSEIYNSVVELEKRVIYYTANTGFEDIPPETKQALNRIYQMNLQLKTAIEADVAFDPLIITRYRPVEARTGPTG